MDAAKRVRRRKKGMPRAIGLPPLAPVLRDDVRGRAVRLETLGHLSVQRPPLQPRDLCVERLPNQGMTEHQRVTRPLDEDAATKQLLEPVAGPRDLRHQRGVDRLARNSGHHRAGPHLLRQSRRTEEDSITDAVRQWKIRPLEQLEPFPARPQTLTRRQRQPELLDEEGHAVRAVDDRIAEGRSDRPAQDPLEQERGRRRIERLDHQLAQPAGAAKLAAEPPDRMAPRNLVASVGRQDQHALALE